MNLRNGIFGDAAVIGYLLIASVCLLTASVDRLVVTVYQLVVVVYLSANVTNNMKYAYSFNHVPGCIALAGVIVSFVVCAVSGDAYLRSFSLTIAETTLVLILADIAFAVVNKQLASVGG